MRRIKVTHDQVRAAQIELQALQRAGLRPDPMVRKLASALPRLEDPELEPEQTEQLELSSDAVKAFVHPANAAVTRLTDAEVDDLGSFVCFSAHQQFIDAFSPKMPPPPLTDINAARALVAATETSLGRLSATIAALSARAIIRRGSSVDEEATSETERSDR